MSTWQEVSDLLRESTKASLQTVTQNQLWSLMQGLLMSHGCHGDMSSQLFMTSDDCCGPPSSPLPVISLSDLVSLALQPL